MTNIDKGVIQSHTLCDCPTLFELTTKLENIEQINRIRSSDPIYLVEYKENNASSEPEILGIF